MAAAQPTGLPPNVLPCVPGVMHWQQCVTAHIDGDSALTFIMGQSQRAALTGYTPPLSACSKTLSFASTLRAIKRVQDLAQYDNVRPHAVVVAGEQPPCSRNASLDLVTNEENVVLHTGMIARACEGSNDVCTFLHSAAAAAR